MSHYLETLTRRLTAGLSGFPADFRARHASYLRSTQNADGGFQGRDPHSDLYYTGFALRGLALLDALDDETAGRAVHYLRKQLHGKASITDFLSLLYGALLLQAGTGADVFAGIDPSWREAVATTLESFRREDGGYARTVETPAGSTYHSFLVVLCLQMLNWPVPQPDRLAAFVCSRQREDGGFVEIPAMKRSGTNPTAAAIALLRILDALPETVAQSAAEYLADRQGDEGGLAANTRIPVADALSTFTGLLSLADLGRIDFVKKPPIKNYILSLELPTGGFRGAVLDPGHDVEYTFYALGTLALA